MAGGWETQYTCCSAAIGSTGCQVAKVSVLCHSLSWGALAPSLSFPSLIFPPGVETMGKGQSVTTASTAQPLSPALPFRAYHLIFPSSHPKQHVQDGRKENLEGFVKTFEKELSGDAHPGVYALDCEMVSEPSYPGLPQPSGGLLPGRGFPVPLAEPWACAGVRRRGCLAVSPSPCRAHIAAWPAPKPEGLVHNTAPGSALAQGGDPCSYLPLTPQRSPWKASGMGSVSKSGA